MSDIFREVDEEVRREQMKKLWERYGGYVIALAVLVILGVGGRQGYQYWQSKIAAEAGAQFIRAVSLSEQGKHDEAEAAFAKIAKEGTASYRALAGIREAAEMAQRDPKAAVESLDKLSADRALGPALQDLAALRAGYILADNASYDELNRRIGPLTGPDRAFRHSARALLALAAWRATDPTAARRWIDMITADPETPSSIRSQSDVLLAMIRAGGKS